MTEHKIEILKPGDVIVLAKNYGYTAMEFLGNHQPWIVTDVIKGEHRSMRPGCVRLRSMDGMVAKTEWLFFYDDEFTFDPFLTAVHKSQKPHEKSKT